MSARLIVGLGNPGPKYQDNRHNVGFRCVDHISKQWDIPFADRREKAALGEGYRHGHHIVLAKPRTFMNRSGEGIQYLLTRFGATPADLIVIYDELHLPLGKIRIRPAGSAAGHNGIRSIIAAIHTQEFPRIRVGIGGQPMSPAEQVSYVLGQFTAEESPLITEVIARVAQAADALLQEPIDTVMNRFN